MEFQEYPKSLYMGGTWESVEAGLHKIVKDKDEEDAVRAEGYLMLTDEKEPVGDKESLLAEAKELGIDAKGTWGIAKLQAAIEEAKAKE